MRAVRLMVGAVIVLVGLATFVYLIKIALQALKALNLSSETQGILLLVYAAAYLGFGWVWCFGDKGRRWPWEKGGSE